MNELKHQIDYLERKIHNDNHDLQDNLDSLKKHENGLVLMSVLLVSSFTFAFVVARKKSVPYLIRKTIHTGLKAKTLYQKIKLVLPFIPV